MLYKCGHTTHAPATDYGQAPGAAKGDTSYFTVDLHCHLHVLEADALLEGVTPAGAQDMIGSTNQLTADINRRQQQTILTKLTDPAERIADMDATGVDVQAIAPSPSHYYYGYEVGAARDAIKVVNDRIAEVVGQYPERFVGLCTVPLQDVDVAVAELERSVGELGLRGVEISTNVNGTDLTRAGLEKFFQRVEELGVMIFMHPIGTSIRERFYDHYFQNTIGHPLESALAIGNLVFDGYLETYPDLKILIAHGGGYIPAYSGRWDHPYHLPRRPQGQHLEATVGVPEEALLRHRRLHPPPVGVPGGHVGRRSRRHGHRLPLRHDGGRARALRQQRPGAE